MLRPYVVFQLLGIGTGSAANGANDIPLSYLGQVVGGVTLLVFQARVYANGFEDINLEVMRPQEFLHLGVGG